MQHLLIIDVVRAEEHHMIQDEQVEELFPVENILSHFGFIDSAISSVLDDYVEHFHHEGD